LPTIEKMGLIISSMNRPLKMCAVAIGSLVLLGWTMILPVNAESTSEPYSDRSIEELKEEIDKTKGRLDSLPLRLIRESGGTAGFRVKSSQNTPEELWVEVDLGDQVSFDTIVLIPVVMISEGNEYRSYGFPPQFQIRAYSSPADQIGELLFDSTVTPLDLPVSHSPIIIPISSTASHSARRIRVIPLELSKTSPLDESYLFTLSELLVFKDKQNLALGKEVVAPHATNANRVWHTKYLTDGYMPYSSPEGRQETIDNYSQLLAPMGRVRERSVPSITLDLGKAYPLDEVRLYPVYSKENFASFHKTGLGFPVRFRIEVSMEEGFESAVPIFATGPIDYPSPGHRLSCFSANNTSGRFVRISGFRLPLHPRKKESILF